MKILLLIILLTIGAQCREYYYNKPNVPFSREDGKQHQYLLPFSSMSIPGSHGRNYEVSMTPSRNIFEMHLGQHQYYTQDQANNVAYSQQQQSGAHYQQPFPTYQLQQGNAYAQQPGNAYPQQLGNSYSELSDITLSSQPTAKYPRQIAFNPNFPNGLAQSGITNPQLNLSRRPNARILKVCYTSGRCEFVGDNVQLQRILQQSRTKLPSSPLQSQSSQSPFGSIIGGTKAQRDRRLFPYSELPIAQYPFKK